MDDLQQIAELTRAAARQEAATRGPLAPAMAEVRPLLALTVPIVAGFACSTLITVADTIMVAPLGTDALAAASLTSSAMILFFSAIYGLLMASGIRIAEHLGAKDGAEAGRSLRAGLVLGALSGAAGAAVMAALLPALPLLGPPQSVLDLVGPYWLIMAVTLVPWSVSVVLIGALNAEGRAWQGFVVGAAQLAADVPLNWLLIHGAGLGLAGAGVASLLATLISVPLALWLLRKATRGRAPAARPIGPEVAVQWRAGWPIAVGYTAEGGGYAVAGLMLSALGAAALAANQIVQTVMAVLYMLPLGLAMATSLQVGFARGEGAIARLRPVLVAAVLIVLSWMALFTVLLVIGGEAVARQLSDDPEVIALAGALFLVLALMQAFDGVQSASMGALRGLFDTRWPMAVTLITYWVLALPTGWVLGFALGLGAPGVWLGYTMGVALAAILLPWRFWRMTRAADALPGADAPRGARLPAVPD